MAITDLIDRVTDSSTGRPIIATLAAPGKALAASSINLAAATNWTTTTAIHFSIYETTTVGSTVVKNASTQTDWKGTLSGTAISNLTITGGTDRAYTAGAIVELTPTARYAKDLYDWAMSHANQDGSLITSAVTTALTANTVTNTMLATGAAVTNSKLSTTAGELGGAWLAWTPTWANLTLGNGTVSAAYNKIGKTINLRLTVVFGSTSSMGVSRPTFTLPVAAHSAYSTAIVPSGSAIINDTSATTAYIANVAINGSTTVATIARPSADPAQWFTVTSTSPMTWASGDSISLTMTYEAA